MREEAALSPEVVEKLLAKCGLTLDEAKTLSLKELEGKFENEVPPGKLKDIIGFRGNARDINYSTIVGQIQFVLQQSEFDAPLNLEVIETCLQKSFLTYRKEEWVNEINDDELYIPVRGADSRFASARQFDVREEVDGFLSDTQKERKVLLLLGESGSGKTMFCQNLAMDLANCYHQTPNKMDIAIPLYIWLPHIKELSGRLIEEHLERYGLKPNEIEHLKSIQRQFIFILDSYDEIRGSHKEMKNLFVHNHLDRWNAKVIISCRTTYLTNTNRLNYEQFFAPFVKEHQQPIKEINLLPFDEKQILQYIDKYLTVRGQKIILQGLDAKWLKPETYFCEPPAYDKPEIDYLHKITGLLDLIKTPFLLKVTMEVLPHTAKRSLAELQEGQWQQETKDALLERFVTRWFERQLGKLIVAKERVSQATVNDFEVFSELVAVYMERENQIKVTYLEAIKSVFGSCNGLWKDGFSESGDKLKDVIALAFKGCPLQHVSTEEYTFLHLDIQDYFYTRAQKREQKILGKIVVPKIEHSSAFFPPMQLPVVSAHIPMRPRNAYHTASGFSFEHCEVAADGNCGYTAFGIDRDYAYQLLKDNLLQIRDLLAPVVQEELLKEKFIDYLSKKDFAGKSLVTIFQTYQTQAQEQLNIEPIQGKLLAYANDLNAITGYLSYDVKDKQIDAGWSHPAVLQALASIRGIELYIWIKSGNQLLPHPQYPHLTPAGATEKKHLLFVNGNHFELLLEQASQENTRQNLQPQTEKQLNTVHL